MLSHLISRPVSLPRDRSYCEVINHLIVVENIYDIDPHGQLSTGIVVTLQRLSDMETGLIDFRVFAKLSIAEKTSYGFCLMIENELSFHQKSKFSKSEKSSIEPLSSAF